MSQEIAEGGGLREGGDGALGWESGLAGFLGLSFSGQTVDPTSVIHALQPALKVADSVLEADGFVYF